MRPTRPTVRALATAVRAFATAVRAFATVMAIAAVMAIATAPLCGHARADETLHERVVLGSQRCKGGVCTSNGEVRAIEQDGKMLPAPTDGPAPVPGEQVFSPEPERVQVPPAGGPPLPGDPPPERRPMVRMDRETGAEAAVSHTYHTVFTPSEFPYKRMSSLDWVTDDEVLTVFDQRREPVPVVGASQRRTDHDAFWGSIVLDLEPGKWIPMPSVAPDSRILEYRTDPPTEKGALEFAHDSADNFFVRATARSAAGSRRRLVWLTDAPQRYFSGPILDARLDDEPRALLRPIPPRLKRTARSVLDALSIRVSPHASLRSVLDPLVAHFRAFETGALPQPSESNYRDLALARKGVCRHRAFAFTITAMAAGIPTRYVENELHVFVEVYLPKQGWRRINLGGAALDDTIAGGDDKPMHRPRGEDPLPRPKEFLANATPPESPAPGRGEDGKSARGVNGPGESPRPGKSGDGKGPVTRIDLGAVLEDDAKQSVDKPRGKIATRLELAVDSRVAYRGDTVEVSGRVTEGLDAPSADLPVEIYLDGAPGAQRIAQVRTGPDGRFIVVALVPASLQLGNYSLVARTSGDGKRLPSSSRRR